MGLTATLVGIAAAASVATSVTTAVNQRKSAKAAAKQAAMIAEKTNKGTVIYNPNDEKAKVAIQELNANKRRVATETDTHMSSALGNTEGTTTQKKTVLGG